ncbi:MAG: exonuclease domain-containing protein [Clostridiales bacterium]|nr:exonuclease domain-containing protein [Candidatus Equinaster intestinalis]
MHYIILDFEWDTVFYKPEKRFVNQIVQIGAVKLGADFSIESKFARLVKSSFCKKVSKRFTELTGITTEDMLSGVAFGEAVKEYNEWVGPDIITLTWSNSDLYSVVDNGKLFLEKNEKFLLGKYVDLQSYVQNELKLAGKEISNQISLTFAAEELGISTDNFDMHTALDDSMVTAKILQKTYNAERFAACVRDTENPEFFKRLLFRNTYITKIYDRRVDKKHLEFTCDKCGKKAKPKREKWKYKNHWFCNEFVCENCENQFVGKVMFKVTYTGVKVAKRVLHPEKTPETVEN